MKLKSSLELISRSVCLEGETVSGFRKGRKVNEALLLRDNEKTHKYVSVKDGTLVLTDNIIEAHIFNKQKAGGKSVSDIIFRVFPDVRSIHFEYDYNKLLNIAA